MKLSLYFAATLASLLTTSTALPFDASSYNLDARDLGDFEFHDLAARDFDYELGARDFDDFDVRDLSELEARATPKTPAKPAAKPAPASAKKKGICMRKGKKQKRSNPPSAKSKIPSLFHGTRNEEVAGLRKGIKVENGPGDFHPSGAFYLTDRMETAAQYACHVGIGAKPKTVAVFEYSWDPAGHNVYEFASQTSLWKDYVTKNIDDRSHVCAGWDAITKNDMITGPMRGQVDIDNGLSSNFWQYAATAKGISGLKLKAVHENLDCSKYPQGDC